MWKQKAEQHCLFFFLNCPLNHLVFAFWEQNPNWVVFWFPLTLKSEAGKTTKDIKPLHLSLIWFYNPPFVLAEGLDLFHWGWQWMQWMQKRNIYLSLILRLFSATHLEWKSKLQKAGDFTPAQRSAWFNLINGTQCFSHTHICAYVGCMHIYTVHIHELCA